MISFWLWIIPIQSLLLTLINEGGNAGYAVAYSGRKLKIPVEVFVPSTTPDFMRKNIESQGAKVIVAGNVSIKFS